MIARDHPRPLVDDRAGPPRGLGRPCWGRSPRAVPRGTRSPRRPASRSTEAIARAKPGDVITLAAGTYPGPIRLPAGVGLRGAGYRETTIDAGDGGGRRGDRGGTGAEVADLRIKGGQDGPARRRVPRASSSAGSTRPAAINGIRFLDVTGGRIEDVIARREPLRDPRRRAGATTWSSTARWPTTTASASASPRARATRRSTTASSGTSTGVFVGDRPGRPARPQPLLHARSRGSWRDQLGRRSLDDWKYLCGARRPLRRAPGRRSATPRPATIGRRGRSPGRSRGRRRRTGASRRSTGSRPRTGTSTATARTGRFDAGAFEVATTPARPADGTLTVRSDAGIKSAGIFDGNGREVAYLFHNLPLPAGEHPFWFPARDALGRKIPAGTYEVRSVEADHRWDYLGWVGDTGEAYPPGHTASVGLAGVAFDDAGRLFAAQGWSEDATNVRGYDAATGKVALDLRRVVDGQCGFATGPDGALYFAQPGEAGNWDLSRIDPARREGDRRRAKGPVARPARPLRGRLRPGRARRQALRPDTAGEQGLDRRRRRVAVGVGRRPGAVVHRVGPDDPRRLGHQRGQARAGARARRQGRLGAGFHEPRRRAALAAGDGRLAIAHGRRGTGPRPRCCPTRRPRPTSGWTIGRGDGPYGPYLPDRFLFQQAPGHPRPPRRAGARAPGASWPSSTRTGCSSSTRQGHYLWGTFGVFGNNTAPSFADPRRVYDTDGRRSLQMTVGPTARGTWRPEGSSTCPSSGRFLRRFRLRGQDLRRLPRQHAGPAVRRPDPLPLRRLPGRSHLRHHRRREAGLVLRAQGHEPRRPARRARRRRGRHGPRRQAVPRDPLRTASSSSSPTATCSASSIERRPVGRSSGTPRGTPTARWPTGCRAARRCPGPARIHSPYTFKPEEIERLHLRLHRRPGRVHRQRPPQGLARRRSGS